MTFSASATSVPAIVAVVAAETVLILYEGARSTANLTCSAVRVAFDKKDPDDHTDEMQAAFEACHNHGYIRLPGD